jgi:hypothetical protein
MRLSWAYARDSSDRFGADSRGTISAFAIRMLHTGTLPTERTFVGSHYLAAPREPDKISRHVGRRFPIESQTYFRAGNEFSASTSMFIGKFTPMLQTCHVALDRVSFFSG